MPVTTNPLLTRRSVVLAKKETTYGTDAAPTAATDAVLVGDLTVEVDGQKLERDFLRDSIGPLKHKIGRVLAKASFTTEVKTDGTTAADGADAKIAVEIDQLLQGCGFEVTLVPEDTDDDTGFQSYTPVSAAGDMSSLTIWVYLDGIVHKITGAYGTFRLIAEAGQYARMEWEFTGLYNAVTDLAIATGTFDTSQPLVVESIGFEIGAYTANITQAIEYDVGNTISERPDVNSADGLGALRITQRASTGSINPEAVTVATEDFWGDWKDGNSKACILKVTNASNVHDDWGVYWPALTYESVGYGDRDGIRTFEIPYVAAESSGNDEIEFRFGDVTTDAFPTP